MMAKPQSTVESGPSGMEVRPLNHFDVTGSVRISSPWAVRDAVLEALTPHFPGLDQKPLAHAFLTFTRLYAGDLPGYVGCDTWYHDAQHSLDCALAMARVLDGYERTVAAAERLGARRATLGVIVALFHDAGYIRRKDDKATNGAEYTIGHVRRSGEFLRSYLPTVGFTAEEADLASRIVHYTGYEMELDKIEVSDPLDRLLGFMLGTADILSQCADRVYLEKCRDFLFREFFICGLAGPGIAGGPKPIYSSAEDLLKKTPEFQEKVRQERLDGYFQGVRRYMSEHFGGYDPYTSALRQHLDHLQGLLRAGHLNELRRLPEAVGSEAMREALRDPKLSARPPAQPRTY